MIPLPRWAWPHLLNEKCPNCKSNTCLKYVEGVGLKQKRDRGKQILKGNVLLTFDYNCPVCQKMSIWMVDPQDSNVSAEELAFNIAETILMFMGKKPRQNRSKVSLSKISNKEFTLLKQKLKEFETHDDFLLYIGLPPEQIEKLKKDKDSATDGDQNK